VPEHLAKAHPDLVRSLLSTFVEALMGAEVDAICGAAYHHASPERTNRRNGYRSRPSRYEAWHHPSSKIPKLREGSYFPDWIQERRRRSQG
jgi:putative transposase